MAITIGTRLGPYEVLSPIGAGGMGEVYKARDTRLNRTVAIKVLPEHFADRPQVHERFEREAKTIASLNHPHICTLYDMGHQDGTDYLVMEYLEGETLAERLHRGPLPLRQFLQYAIDIADALDKAHRKGITHRDLKPGNIVLTKSGTKLIDFGLAKLRQEATSRSGPLSTLPTVGVPLTAEGTILGTLNYMAPEQVEGKMEGIDARTDIFAFGVMVYEMATGKKAFEGKNQASVISAILKDDPPPISSLQPMTPPELDRVVKKCLAKEPEKRWQDAGDLCDELKWIAEESPHSSAVVPNPATGIRQFGWRLLGLSGGALLLVATLASFVTWNLKPVALEPVIRTLINLPVGDYLAGLDQPALALSPDGSLLAYVARRGDTQRIYLRAMDSLEPKPVAGTEGAVNPFFSPDGQWIGFFSGGRLKKVPVSGGAAVTLGDAANPRGASWSSKGNIAFTPTLTGGVQQVPDAGGAPQALTRVIGGANSNRWPEFLPSAEALVFTYGTSVPGFFANSQIAVQPTGTGKRRNLVQGTNPHFAPPGHLVYAVGGSLMAVPFDLHRLSISGNAAPVAVGVLQSALTGDAQFVLSATGSLAYIPGGLRAAERKLVWVSRNGEEQPLNAPSRGYFAPRLSPDGRRVAVVVAEQDSQIWLYDVTRETLTRFTFEGNFNDDPTWTPDGKRIGFDSIKEEGSSSIFWQLADGSGGPERLATSRNVQAPQSYSSEGRLLAFVEFDPATGAGAGIWTLPVGGPSGESKEGPQAQPFLRPPFNHLSPRFSPDGHWLAYASDESGRYQVYIQAYPGPSGKYQVSTEGGTAPVWNRSGHELFYSNGNKMMAVKIATQSAFTASTPRMLFEETHEPSPAQLTNYDISADGQRFLMLKPVEQGEIALTQIVVVQNWFEELKRRVPTSK
jgi:serine/threonine protein kinase/Tol biopolymer transport system component